MKESSSERLLSPKAVQVWNRLGSRQRELIRKDCAYRMDRNSVLRNLRMRGVPLKVLAELSGLSEYYLCYLMKFKQGRPLLELGNLKVEIGRLRGAISKVAAEVARLKEERPTLREVEKAKPKQSGRKNE
jgi:hypothetical protein